MRSVIIIFAALLLVAAAPFAFASIDEAASDEYTENFNSISTGAAVTTSNVTLAQDIYEDHINQVISISSNVSSDSPSATAINTVSRLLDVSGLSPSTIRTLSVTYRTDSSTMPSGMSTFWLFLRWFYVFMIIGFAGGAIYAFFD